MLPSLNLHLYLPLHLLLYLPCTCTSPGQVVTSLPSLGELTPSYLTTTYLAGGLGGAVAVALLCFSCCLFVKYRLERSKKMEAIENAHKVAAWTKKVMVERQNSQNGGLEPQVKIILIGKGVILALLQVTIEKVRMEKPGWRDSEDSGEVCRCPLLRDIPSCPSACRSTSSRRTLSGSSLGISFTYTPSWGRGPLERWGGSGDWSVHVLAN